MLEDTQATDAGAAGEGTGEDTAAKPADDGAQE